MAKEIVDTTEFEKACNKFASEINKAAEACAKALQSVNWEVIGKLIEAQTKQTKIDLDLASTKALENMKNISLPLQVADREEEYINHLHSVIVDLHEQLKAEKRGRNIARNNHKITQTALRLACEELMIDYCSKCTSKESRCETDEYFKKECFKDLREDRIAFFCSKAHRQLKEEGVLYGEEDGM